MSENREVRLIGRGENSNPTHSPFKFHYLIGLTTTGWQTSLGNCYSRWLLIMWTVSIEFWGQCKGTNCAYCTNALIYANRTRIKRTGNRPIRFSLINSMLSWSRESYVVHVCTSVGIISIISINDPPPPAVLCVCVCVCSAFPLYTFKNFRKLDIRSEFGNSEQMSI